MHKGVAGLNMLLAKHLNSREHVRWLRFRAPDKRKAMWYSWWPAICIRLIRKVQLYNVRKLNVVLKFWTATANKITEFYKQVDGVQVWLTVVCFDRTLGVSNWRVFIKYHGRVPTVLVESWQIKAKLSSVTFVV